MSLPSNRQVFYYLNHFYSIMDIKKIVNGPNVPIVVIGDIILDEYYSVHITRVSPEFPVQVMNSSTGLAEKVMPGGAGNVANQFKHFNITPYLLGFVDSNFIQYRNKLSFNTDFCVKLNQGQIPVKRRFYDGDFPLPRWDIEKPNYGLSEDKLNKERHRLLENILKVICHIKPKAVILSDYGKGLFNEKLVTKIIEVCNLYNIMTIVDPKENISWFKNCTIFKPNSIEAARLTGLKLPEEQCLKINDLLGCKSIITQGGKGVVGLDDHYFSYHPKKSQDSVQSVIGAGDCFCAFLAMSLAYGNTLFEAAKLAYEAGAVYVQAKHNQPITKHQLLSWFDPSGAKIVSPDDLVKRDFDITFTNGCFDILHHQHINLFKYAKSIDPRNKLVVAINDDNSVKRLKGNSRPITPLNERMEILACLETIDFVIPFSDDTPLELIKLCKPSCIVKGGDYKPKDVVGYDEVNGKVFIFPYKKGVSTTNILKKIENKK